ncbi:MAG: hypothetical protein ACJASP_001496 [Roseivirga sp.]|jgi:hypothetical protein
MNRNESEYQEILDNYGDNAWLALPVFIRETDLCFLSLGSAIGRNDLPKSREDLHQMIGASKIMNAVEVEQHLLSLQTIVKSSEFPKSCDYYLEKIKAQVNDLYEFSVENRKAYHLYLLYNDEDTFNKVEELFDEKIQLSFSATSKLGDCISYLSSNHTDVIVTDYKVDSYNFTVLSDFLQSSYSNTPVLLIDEKADGNAKESQKEHPNISGSILKGATINQWLELIKTVANGHDCWQ